MKRKHNMLDNKHNFKLYKYLEHRSVDGKIDLRVGKLTEEAKLALDFEVTTGNIRNACRNLEIELIWNQSREKVEKQDNVEVLVQRLASIEDKLDALLKAWDVKCGRLL